MGSEAVEIKVNLSTDVEQAVQLLGLDAGHARRIWFYEDVTPGLPQDYPLFRAGVILRVRAKDDGSGDSTVKLRPCRRSQLVDAWSVAAEQPDQWSYDLQWDWSGERRVLAASLTAELGPGVAVAVDPRVAYGGRQREFLAACADLRVNLDALTALGPIAATKWEKQTVGGVAKVNVERWTAAGLDFLELSRKVGGDEAATAQVELEKAAREVGLLISEDSASKTEQFLTALAAH